MTHLARCNEIIIDPLLDLSSGSHLCLFNEPSGVTLAMIQAAQK